MKIIIMGNLEELKIRMDNLDYEFLAYLKKKSKNEIFLYDANSEYDNIKCTLDSDKNAIILVFSAAVNYISQFHHKKIYYVYDVSCRCKYKCDGCLDTCAFNTEKCYIQNNNFCYIFYKYETYITRKMFENEKSGLFVKYKFPHFMFDLNTYKNKHCEKEIDILFYGATYLSAYPFRSRLLYLLNKHTDKFNFKVLPYSKKHVNTMIRGHDLVNMINKSWLTIATKSLNNLLLAKYYEIALSGSVVCGDYPDLENEIFLKNDNMIYIDNDMSNEQIINIISNALNDKKKLLEISQRTSEYFSNNYSMDCGVTYFDNLIDSLS